MIYPRSGGEIISWDWSGKYDKSRAFSKFIGSTETFREDFKKF
jgi:hypothetical protein